MTQQPTWSATLDQIHEDYGASKFRTALSTFLSQHTNPQTPQPEFEDDSSGPSLSLQCIPVFHKIKLWVPDPQGRSEVADTCDVVHTHCCTITRAKRRLSTRFDTVLISVSAEGGPGNHCGANGENSSVAYPFLFTDLFWYRLSCCTGQGRF